MVLFYTSTTCPSPRPSPSCPNHRPSPTRKHSQTTLSLQIEMYRASFLTMISKVIFAPFIFQRLAFQSTYIKGRNKGYNKGFHHVPSKILQNGRGIVKIRTLEFRSCAGTTSSRKSQNKLFNCVRTCGGSAHSHKPSHGLYVST